MTTHGVQKRLPAVERALLERVSRSALRCHLEWLQEFGLRLGGTAREREAVAYVIEQLRVAGIECEEHEFDAFVSHTPDASTFGPAKVVVLGDPVDEFEAKAYAFAAPTGDSGVSGDVVDVGIGAADAYRVGDVRGRIVLSRLSFDCPHSEPARVAQEHGAAGLIVSNWSQRDGPRIHTSTAKWAWGNPTARELASGVASIPVVSISASDGERLRDRLRRGTVRAAVFADASRQWVRTSQPIAHIRGRTEEFVLLHCHLDTFGHGVTDNGTGVAGLLELARILQQEQDRLRRSIRIAWLSCHEMPSDGSPAYPTAHWDDFRDRCVATANADSWALSGSAGRLVGLSFAEVEDAVSTAIADVVGTPFRIGDFGPKEAEQSFWSIGIPSLFVFSASPDFPDGPITGTWFHTEFDTIEHVDEDALEQLVRTYGLLAVRLATSEPLPFSYVPVARRLSHWLGELRALAPRELRLDDLADAVERLTGAAEEAEHILGRLSVAEADRALMQIARRLNPVIYSTGGPYEQDPVAAAYVSRRIPGLRLSLERLKVAEGDELLWPACLTQAVRDRNRLADAIAGATEILAEVAQSLRT